MIVGSLNRIDGISCHVPEGAFYVFPSCEGLLGRKTPSGQVLKSDEDFIMYLLDEENLAVLQGAAYGVSPFFRISYAAAMDELEEGCARIKRACAKLG